MSLPDSMPLMRDRRKRPGAAMLGGLAMSLLAAAGCTVQPLYASRGFGAATQESAYAADASTLPAVDVEPVTTREGLEVRNQLLFLLNGGARQPESPRYSVRLTVVAVSQSSATIQVARDEEPTAAQAVLTASYVILDNYTEKGAVVARPVVAQGSRQILSAFDVPRQEYAVARARRDAQNRAARELAELLRLAIAQDLMKVKRGVGPAGVASAVAAPADTIGTAASTGTSDEIQ